MHVISETLNDEVSWYFSLVVVCALSSVRCIDTVG